MEAWAMPAVVIENGSYNLKAGFSCDNHPLCMFRTVIGRPKYLEGGYGHGVHYEVLIGEEAELNSDEYDLTQPVVNGMIVDWDNIERIWHHLFFRELRVAPEDRSVFLTCPVRMSMADKIKCCEVFLELLNVPAVCIQPSASLTMFSYGQSTGMTIELGFDTTQITPIYEGTSIKYANVQTGYAGRQVFEYVQDCLKKREVNLGKNPGAALDTIMKECFYVTQDTTMPRFGYTKYANVFGDDYLEVSQESFMASEMYFLPDMVMQKRTGYLSLPEAITTALNRVDLDLRDEVMQNVVMSGAPALIQGIGKRLEIELSAIMAKPITVSISDEAHVSSWMGGALFAGVKEAFGCLWVTKKQYDDYGAKIIRRRFIP